ncbi:MAG: flippase-like domain-containing protein [Synergistaceae bacterium]|nr:flippase-like domain-containing protein [Synergistaceae bacterium]
MCGALIYFSFDRDSLAIFREASGFKLYLAFSLVVCVWLLDALKMMLLARAAGAKMGYRSSMELTWINYFGSAITPMQSGGGPFQMYLMYQNGISVGKSVAITIIRTVLVMLILGMMIPFAVMIKGDTLKLGWGARGFIFYVVLFILVIWLALIVSIVKPVLVKRLSAKIISLLRRVGILKKEWESRLLKLAIREIDAYTENVWAFMTTGRRHFIGGVAVAFLQILAQLSVMPCMIWALGFEVWYPECVLVQATFLFLLYFIPTPGGSGAAEGGAALVFSMFVPWSVAGMLGVGWRMLTEYTGIVLGAIVAVRRIGWKLASELITHDAPDKTGESKNGDAGGGEA